MEADSDTGAVGSHGEQVSGDTGSLCVSVSEEE